MQFITPDDILKGLNCNSIAMDINMLTNGSVKLQTIHNHTSRAFLAKDLDVYISKTLAKAYFKFLSTHDIGEK